MSGALSSVGRASRLHREEATENKGFLPIIAGMGGEQMTNRPETSDHSRTILKRWTFGEINLLGAERGFLPQEYRPRLVIIESPYAGDIETNTDYARAAMRDSLERGEYPIASHLLYTQPGILDEFDPKEREWGIRAGLAWREVAHAAVFYSDLGWSTGMLNAAARYDAEGFDYEERTIAQWDSRRMAETGTGSGRSPTSPVARKADAPQPCIGDTHMSDEREAIVRWLRERAPIEPEKADELADAIERGDHLAPKE